MANNLLGRSGTLLRVDRQKSRAGGQAGSQSGREGVAVGQSEAGRVSMGGKREEGSKGKRQA